jgi:hypothetical protein
MFNILVPFDGLPGIVLYNGLRYDLVCWLVSTFLYSS